FHRFGKIQGDTLPALIHDPEVELRLRIALVGRFAVPFQRLGIILRNLPPDEVDRAKRSLRLRIALFRFGAGFFDTVSQRPALKVAHGQRAEQKKGKHGLFSSARKGKFPNRKQEAYHCHTSKKQRFFSEDTRNGRKRPGRIDVLLGRSWILEG